MKLTKLLLTVVLIPTFVFLTLAVCCCPNAKAMTPSGEVSINQPCCCSHGSLITGNKDQGVLASEIQLPSLSLEALLTEFPSSHEIKPTSRDVLVSSSPPLFYKAELSTIQLLI